ncbi:hypothetical protein [Veillonella sp. VA142]|uniref:hypothetical protein n=1 Tax=Veillonella sp. VA142 TaxID=741834 RepID=UPI001F0B9D20|nr:hypothetical protein [Veillonella sp. VA142]
MQHKRPKMTLLQRAKQFMPFAALKGFQELLEETAQYKESRKELSEEQLEVLDKQCKGLVIGNLVSVVYHNGRVYDTVQGRLEQMDRVYRTMTVEGVIVPMSHIMRVTTIG